MNIKKSTSPFSLIFMLWILITTIACSLSGATELTQETPTPTSGALGPSAKQTTTPSLCSGLLGELEVMVLVGPAEAVGLEPFSVGTIPIFVTTEAPPYFVDGSKQLVYQDMLVEEWGTYSVDLTMDIAVTGECVEIDPNGNLDLTVEMTGEQMVEVISEGFHGEYPWAGTHSLEIDLQLMDGASVAGEGWEFILHLEPN